MPGPALTPTGVVYSTRNRDGDHNLILVYAYPYGFKVLEGPAVHVDDPLIDALQHPHLKQRVTQACEQSA